MVQSTTVTTTTTTTDEERWQQRCQQRHNDASTPAPRRGALVLRKEPWGGFFDTPLPKRRSLSTRRARKREPASRSLNESLRGTHCIIPAPPSPSPVIYMRACVCAVLCGAVRCGRAVRGAWCVVCARAYIHAQVNPSPHPSRPLRRPPHPRPRSAHPAYPPVPSRGRASQPLRPPAGSMRRSRRGLSARRPKTL